MERSNYHRGSGRGGGGRRGGGGGDCGRGAQDQHDYHRQQYRQPQYQRGGGGGGGGGWGRGPAYQPPGRHWSPRPFRPQGGSYRPHPHPPAEGTVATRPETGETSVGSYGGGGRGAWGSSARGWSRVPPPFPASSQSCMASEPRPDDAELEHVMEKVLDKWREVGLKFSAADEEFLERSRKKFGREDWPWKVVSIEAPHSLKPAAAVEKQKTSGKYILKKVEELKREAMVLKRWSDLLHLVLSYPMKPETSKQSQPCCGSYFSDINQKIKQLEILMFDESLSSAAPPVKGHDMHSRYWNVGFSYPIINSIRNLLDRVEKDLCKFDFEIAPYLEKQPPKAKAAADVQEGSGSSGTKHHVADNSVMRATIDKQFKNTPPPAPPMMHKLATDFAVRQILRFFESRTSGSIGISGRGWEQVLEALKGVPNVTSMFDFVQSVSLDRHQSMLELHMNILRQAQTKSNEGSTRFLLLADSIDQKIDLDYQNLDVCIVFQTQPQRANYEPLEVDLEIRMEDHLLPWNLFWKKAGRVLLSTTTLQQKLEYFIKESHGHLLAIILLTRALQDETYPSMWEFALCNQQPAETTIHDQLDAVMINVLRFIWERLDTTTKNCIKYFIVHQKEEEKEIPKDSLIGLWISSGCIEKSEEGSPILKKLINCFFLEDVGRDHFRMREETKLGLLNIFAPGQRQPILDEGDRDLSEPPEAEKWNAKEIHLRDNKISKLPENPNCSILIKLYLQGNNDLMVIPSSFFNCMPVLHVLDLSFTSIKSLPESISKLVSLRKFFLRGCDMLTKLPPEIGALKRLEEFDLEGTYLLFLPKEIGELVNLAHFKVCLSGCVNLCKQHKGVDTIIPRKALSNLQQLKELSINVIPDGDWWDVEVRAIINEICWLSRLEELKLYLPMAEAFKKVGSYKVFKKFRLIVGRREQWSISRLPHEVEEEFNNSEKFAKGLKYINGEGEPTEEITQVLKNANAFSLERHWTVKNLSKFGHENMKKLEFCCLVECNEIQTIIDVEDDAADDEDDLYSVLDKLKYLSVHYMKSMQSICKVPAKKGLVIMPMLNSLALHACPSLNTIFTIAMLWNLVNLKELIVEDCPNINSLVTLEDSTLNLGHFLPKLKKISLLFLPELVSISSGLCIAPELGMMIIFHCPKLQMLSSTDVSSKDLKVIKADREWWTALRWHESDRSSGRQSYLAKIFIPLDIGDLKDEQPWRSTAGDSDSDTELSPRKAAMDYGRWELVAGIFSEWRGAGRKLSAADEEFFRRILKEGKYSDWEKSRITEWLLETELAKEPANPLKPAAKERLEELGWKAPSNYLKPAAAVALEKERSEERRLKALELRQKALMLKRSSDLLHLILSYPMKEETSKCSQPCLQGYFSTINWKLKQLENLTFDESSSAAAPRKGDDITNTIQEQFDEVEKNLRKFDFEIAPYLEKPPRKADLEKQPLKAAAADVEGGSGLTGTKHVNVIVDNSTMPATIAEQSENAPPPSPAMHKLAIDFAVRQILDFFKSRKSGKIGISGSTWDVLKALNDVPNITSKFDFIIQNVSLDLHQSMVELCLNIAGRCWDEGFRPVLLLVYSINQDIDLNYLISVLTSRIFGVNVCIVFPTQPQRANYEPLEVDLEIRMEDHLLPWNLFWKKAGRVLLSTTTLQQKLEYFIKESHGHLLAIVLLTRALQDETDPSVWEFALCNQQPAETTVHDQLDAVMINVLRFIWERLDTTTKNCIKYFIVHQKEEEKEIPKDSLIGLWISSGCIEKSEEGSPILKKLINCFFLEDVGRDHFRMREETKLGLLNILASGQRQPILDEGDRDLSEPPEAEKWNAKEIHLRDNKISKLPENPNCSILIELYLQGNNDLMVIPSSFFNCMPVLHVLDLSFTSIKSLPESISKLVSLQKFFLRGCEMLTKLPPEIGALKRLEEFDLEGTFLLYLPKEIGELVNLAHFKVCLSGCVNFCKQHKGVDTIIPRKALSNLHQLKELSINMIPNGDWWDVEVRAIINEICSLSRLEELKLYLPMAEALKEVRAYKKFRLIVGRREQWFISRLPHEVEEQFNNFAKGLKYINGEGEPTEEITKVLKRANAFSLERHWTVKNLSEFGHENMEVLEFCCLVECNEIQTIIDDVEDDEDDWDNDEDDLDINDNDEDDWDCDFENVLDKLKYLSVHYMKSMQSLCKVPAKKGLVIMPRLNYLALHTCPSLNTIFTAAILRNLVNLEELVVEDCPNVSSLVSPECLALASCDLLPSLKRISLLNLPKLVNISGGMRIAPKLQSMIIFYCLNLDRLSSAEVSSKDLKVIKGDIEWWNALKWYKSDLTLDQQDYLASKFIQLDMDMDGDFMTQLKH